MIKIKNKFRKSKIQWKKINKVKKSDVYTQVMF